MIFPALIVCGVAVGFAAWRSLARPFARVLELQDELMESVAAPGMADEHSTFSAGLVALSSATGVAIVSELKSPTPHGPHLRSFGALRSRPLGLKEELFAGDPRESGPRSYDAPPSQ